MLNTSKRFVSTVVDRDRVSVADVGKERFPYSKIPVGDVVHPEIFKYTEAIYFLHALANDRKRLYDLYLNPWIVYVNDKLRKTEEDFRVVGIITPDYRYKVMKCTVITKEDRKAFKTSKQSMLDLLAKYQQERYASGTYTAVSDASISPSIIETIECPFDDYLGFVPEDNSFIVVPKRLHDHIFMEDLYPDPEPDPDPSGSSSDDDSSSSDGSGSSV